MKVAATWRAMLCVCGFAGLHRDGSRVAGAAASAPSGGGDSLFVPHRADSPAGLLTLATNDSSDTELLWTRYEQYVMSRARESPLILYFDTRDCESVRDATDSDEDDEEELPNDPMEQPHACVEAQVQENAVLLAALDSVAVAKSQSSNLQIVRAPQELVGHMLRYHRVTARTSLLWIPPRSSKSFQRYPHPETNFLDLSSHEKLLEAFTSIERGDAKSVSAKKGKPNGESEASPSPSSPQEQLSAVITEFIRQWYMKSKLSPSTPSRSTATAQQERSESSSSSLGELLPVLGLLAFLGFVVFDNRDLVLRTLQGRFVWFVWSMGVMYVAYAGVFHAMIHRMSLFYFHPQYGFVFFHPSGRRQFVLEGLLSGSWSFLVSLGAFNIVEIVPMLRSKSSRDETFRLSLLLIGFAYTILYFTFISKHRWLTT